MKHYLTKEGLEKLKQELAHMKTVMRKEVIERIMIAKDLGDLKENAEYAEAKDDQAMLEAKITEYETIVKQAEIINEQTRTSNKVSIGSKVKVECSGAICTYTIVGSEETDPANAKISHESPIGKAFLNKQVGEFAIVKVPKGEFKYVILEIE